MKMKEFVSNVLKVVVFGCLVLFVSSFFTKELSADDSDGQGSVKKLKIVKIDSRKKTGRRQAHVLCAEFDFTSIYDLKCGQK